MSWELKRLADICEIKLGKTPSRNDKSYWDDEKSGTNIWVSIADLSKLKSRYTSDSKEYISNKGAALFHPVKSGTLLMSFKLSIGKLAYANCDLYTNEAIVALPIKDKNQINSDFLYYYLQFYDWDKETENDIKLKGKTLNKAKLNEIEIPLPPLATQKKIVEKLDAIFIEIDKATAAAEANAKNAKALFQSYLTEIFEHGGDGWLSDTIGNLCNELFAGGDVPKDKMSKSKSSNFPIPIFTNGEKEKGLYGFTNLPRVTKPSITISARGTIGYSEVRYDPFYPAIRLLVATPNTDIIEIDYLKYAIKSLKFTHSGASIPQLTVPMVKNYQIKLPKSKNEQIEIVGRLDTLSMEIENLRNSAIKKLSQLTNLRQSILNQAFNGELVKE